MGNISKEERERRAAAAAAAAAAQANDNKPDGEQAPPVSIGTDAPESNDQDAGTIGTEDATEEQTIGRVQIGTEFVKLAPGEPAQDPSLGTRTPAWMAWKKAQE